MPGAQDRWDQLAEPHVRSQEPLSQFDPPRIADRPERGTLADLRQRLERLPAGHPSSPYNDDLSRKPPVARLKDLELPLQGSERETNGTTRQPEHDPGQSAPAFQPGSPASNNGSVGANHAEAGFATDGQSGTAGWSSATDWSTSTDWTPAADGSSSPADPSRGPTDTGSAGADLSSDYAAGSSGPADRISTTTDLSSIIARLRASDRVSADDPHDRDRELGASEPPGTDDGLGTDDGIGASHQPGTADRLRARDRPGADGGIGGDSGLGSDDGIGSGDRPGADQAIGADDGLSATGRVGPRGWGGADRLSAGDDAAVSANGASATDWTIAADEVGAEPGPGDAHWSSTDDLSNTAEWSRNADWTSARDWDGTPREWDRSSGERDGSASHDSAARATWLEPAPVTDAGRRAATARRDHLADEPRTGLDGSWEWNGRYLTPDECQIADEALNRIRTAEGRNVFGSYGHSGLTPAMRRLEAQLERGQLLPDTESSALKPADLFKQRLADLIQRHPDKPADELSYEVHDGIRYVYIFEAEHYADATLQVHSRLKGQGFELEVRRNSWRNPEYKGINTRWRDPAHDIVFEVQFHTPQSWDARQRADASFQKITDAATMPAERGRLRALQAEASAAIPIPPRCTAIPDYRKEAL